MAGTAGGGEAGLVLHASHTHLFRGARLRAAGAERAGAVPFDADEPGERTPPRPTDAVRAAPTVPTTDVRVVFSDYSDAEAALTASEAAPTWTLSVDAYRTAAGTELPARAWELEPLPGDGAPAFKVVARRQGSDS